MNIITNTEKLLAHKDAPEIWENGVLKDGGKHYGHLEVNVAQKDGKWVATLEPVYVLPIFDPETKKLLRFERRVYRDVVTLTRD